MKRPIVAVIAFVVGVNVLLFAVGKLLPSPHGRDSSSYATTARGFAAWAELLERNGYPVERERSLPAQASFDARATSIVIDPDTVTDEDAEALARQVEAGATLVAGGPQTHWLRKVLGSAPSWHQGGAHVWNRADSEERDETAGIDSVETDGRARYKRTPGAEPLLSARDTTLVAVARHGNGRVLLLADSSPLQNKLLDHRDNALFALRVAGARGTPVRFYESLHGYGAQRGLRALPGNWKLALIGLALAGVVWLLARGHRLGPAEPGEESRPPPRRAYVDALAATLRRTKMPDAAVEALRQDVLARSKVRGGSR